MTQTAWTLEVVRSRCEEIGDCWRWRGALNGAGHPIASVRGAPMLVRRLVHFELSGRKPRAGYRVAVRCGDPLCVAPGCLLQRTHAEILRLAAAQRLARDPLEVVRRQRMAVDAGIARLNPELAAEVRASTLSNSAMARELGVHRQTIRLIRAGKAWRAPTITASVFALAQQQEVEA